jgi:hypothetical protein
MRWLKKLWWLFVALLTGLLYILFKSILQNKKNGKIQSSLDNINIIAENKLAQIYQEEKKLKKRREENEKIVKKMSRDKLINDIRSRL